MGIDDSGIATTANVGRSASWQANPGGRDVPIDILGGGLSVAPPTTNSKGQYRFIRGGLEDVRRLPTMRGLARESEEIVPPDDIMDAPNFPSAGKIASPIVKEGRRDTALCPASGSGVEI